MKNKILTRFEIFTNGESQGLGFLRGVEDMKISKRSTSSLLYTFNKELPIPPRDLVECSLVRGDAKVNMDNLMNYYKNAGSRKRLVSYFTEKGLQKFNMPIQGIISAVNNSLDYEYSIGKIVVDKDDDLVVYEDKYQVVQISDDLSEITASVMLNCLEDGVYSIEENKISERELLFTRFSFFENTETSNVKPEITIYPFYKQGYLKYIIDGENKLIKITSDVFDY